MASASLKDIKHIYNRFGFALKPDRLSMLAGRSKQQVIDELLKNSQKFTSLNSIRTVAEQVTMLNTLSEEEKKMIFKASGQNILMIGLNWVGKMVHDKAQLRERMVLFWHDHFASSARWDVLVYNQNETLRKFALGSFKDLVKAMCHDPMLLKYLDNDKNRKQSPNENFTRELLELFTLGEGHYSEMDIREGARAFTGHTFTLKGEYVFRAHAHDYGTKTFMGRTGRFDGDAIADIILANKQTARHVTRKIYRYFVNTDVNESLLDELAEDFFRTDYDIEHLVRTILESDWFYEDSNIGTKVKSPIDLVVGLMKQCSIVFKDHKLLVGISKIMGQMPFHPPNVAGWPLGKQWIDSSSLLFRMRLADFLFLGQNIKARGKAPIDMANMKLGDKFFENNDAVTFDLSELRVLAGNGRADEKTERLASFLLNTNLDHSRRVLDDWVARDQLITDMIIINILRMPEYQLC